MAEETDKFAHLTQVLKAYFPEDLTPEQKSRLEQGLEIFKREQERVVEQYVTTIKEEYQQPSADSDGMISDSWFSKNIRPIVLVYLLVLYTIFIFIYPFIYSSVINGQGTIVEKLLEIMANMITVVFAFYFGGRTIEKIAKIFKEKA